MKQIDLPLYKFYLIESMTQEDLNELALINDNQRKFVMEYFKESYEVLGIHSQTNIFDFIGG